MGFKAFVSWLFVLFFFVQAHPQVRLTTSDQTIVLQNREISLIITLNNHRLHSELITAKNKTLFKGQRPSFKITDNFALDINWTGWHAPHKTDNADNPTLLTAKDFRFVSLARKNLKNGGKLLQLYLSGLNSPLQVRITYRLMPGQFWFGKQIAVRDTIFGYHFLRRAFPIYGHISFAGKILKKGGFGQPVVLRTSNGSLFFGTEYPAAHNTIVSTGTSAVLITGGTEVGQKIERPWIKIPAAVTGLMPAHYERLWFDRYLQSQRVQPLRPYVLYNSWYDLRSPAFKNIPPKNIMNETNIMRIIDLIEQNFVRKNGIHLDAFVLDDGWDVYASDWVLRPKQFPHGLKPIARRLKKLNTSLGLWFGPTGGYSFRMQRIRWMGAHGYEVIAKNSDRNHAMMCIAGKHYSQLLKKRTTHFVKNDGVAFFKWDGIQFSCSEADHGHPIGLYSRRAVMDTVISLCQAVRHANPNVFLNITSGTWLSPWWVKYANQIWMGGGDYGYSDVPSISRRDAAMTYRDITLFQDMRVHKFWFPIANLMTHGIIKGQLQKLGGEQEPIEKFTNNALLYFARGVSMWELYISPDILSTAEWKAIGRSLRWARHNFNILKHTFVIGGNPAKDSVYAYVHFNGSQGIVAARNPVITPQTVRIPLSDTLGLDANARNLVLEQVYPYRWISPVLYAAGEEIPLKIDGYQLRVYRIFPLRQARRPLPANIIFRGEKKNNRQYEVHAFAATGELRMLNPSFSRAMFAPGKKAEHIRLNIPPIDSLHALQTLRIRRQKQGITIDVQLTPKTKATVALLLQKKTTDSPKQLPETELRLNGHKIRAKVEQEGGKWAWLKVPLNTQNTHFEFTLKNSTKNDWAGTVDVWLLADIPVPDNVFVFETKKSVQAEILPPLPRADTVLHKNSHLAKFLFEHGMLKQKPAGKK